MKNVACLLSDRSRALARAYVLKRQDDILLSIKNLILLMVKYMYMQSQKSQLPSLTGGGWFRRELKFLGIFLVLISFCNLVFSNNTFALFTPTLSASVDQANLQVNGNQVINSTDKTSEIPFNFTVNTNNRTGYTATLSSETENTALTNATSAVGAKIDSISTNLALNNLPNNTWGYKFGMSTNYAPIPALSSPAQIIQTAGKTNGNESNQLSIGMKLADNLESGNYQNKLILSFVSNPYTMRAVMTNGPDFNQRVGALDPNQTCHVDPVTGQNCNLKNKDNVEHIKRSTVAPTASMAAINIEDPNNSDYEIKAWFDATEKTIYYYSAAEKIHLAPNSSSMFLWFTKVKDIDLATFETSEVTDMSQMFKYCKDLTSLNLSNFDTRNVTNMPRMFEYLTSLTTLNLSNFNTENVVDMRDMFGSMHVLTNLNIASFRTPRVRDMSGMFYSQYQIQSLDVSRFDTSKVTDFSRMFLGNSNIQNLNLSNFSTQAATDMSYMFYGMSNLKNLNIQSFNTENVKDMNSMFAFTLRIPTLNLSHFDTRNVTNMSDMFYGCGSTNIDVSNFNTQNVETMAGMFGSVSNVQVLDLSSFNTLKVKDFSRMFLCDNGQVCELQKIFASNDFDVSVAKQYSQSHLTANYEIFHRRFSLRGGEGTYWGNPDLVNLDGLRIDDPTNGRPGYFTRKP